jgi:hypothetical protein
MPANMALKPTSRIEAILRVWMRFSALSIHQPPSAGGLSADVGQQSLSVDTIVCMHAQ